MKKIILLLLISIGLNGQIQRNNGWFTDGNTVNTNTAYIGTNDNRSLYTVLNGSFVAKFDTMSGGKLYIGNPGSYSTNTLGIGRFRVNHGGLNVDIGSHLFSFAGMHITSATGEAPGYTNFAVYGDGTSATYFNSPNDSSSSIISCGNSTAQIVLKGKQTNSAQPAFWVIGGNRTNVTAGANAVKNYFYGNNTQWKTGAITVYYSNLFQAGNLSAVAASTITDAYQIFAQLETASTNMAITRRWGYGTNGSAHITQSLVVGQAVRTPTATLDLSGTMSVSSTSTLTGIQNNGSFITTTTGSIGTTFTVTGAMKAASTVSVVSTITGNAGILSTGITSGIGYATGSGSTVTQGTNRTTGVTINAINGAITLVSAAGLVTYQTFVVTNSAVAATDVIIVNQKSGTDLNLISVTNVAAGSFKISFATTGGVTVEQPVFNFAVIKGVAN